MFKKIQHIIIRTAFGVHLKAGVYAAGRTFI